MKIPYTLFLVVILTLVSHVDAARGEKDSQANICPRTNDRAPQLGFSGEPKLIDCIRYGHTVTAVRMIENALEKGNIEVVFLIERAFANDVVSSQSELKKLIGGISSEIGQLRWGPLSLGMTVRDVEALIGKPLDLTEWIDTGCGGRRTSAWIENVRIGLAFFGDKQESVLYGISFPVPEDVERQQLVSALKKQISGLIYKPSRHEPNLSEKDNPRPLYVLSTNRKLAVFVRPGFSVSLDEEQCID